MIHKMMYVKAAKAVLRCQYVKLKVRSSLFKDTVYSCKKRTFQCNFFYFFVFAPVHPTDNTRLELIIPGEQHFYVKAVNAAERQKWLVALGSSKAGLIDNRTKKERGVSFVILVFLLFYMIFYWLYTRTKHTVKYETLYNFNERYIMIYS